MKNCKGSKASGSTEISYSLPFMTFAQLEIQKTDSIRAFNHTKIIEHLEHYRPKQSQKVFNINHPKIRV
jgi:hypothetical protein